MAKMQANPDRPPLSSGSARGGVRIARYDRSTASKNEGSADTSRTMAIYTEAKIAREMIRNGLRMHLQRAKNTGSVCRTEF